MSIKSKATGSPKPDQPQDQSALLDVTVRTLGAVWNFSYLITNYLAQNKYSFPTSIILLGAYGLQKYQSYSVQVT